MFCVINAVNRKIDLVVIVPSSIELSEKMKNCNPKFSFLTLNELNSETQTSNREKKSISVILQESSYDTVILNVPNQFRNKALSIIQKNDAIKIVSENLILCN